MHDGRYFTYDECGNLTNRANWVLTWEHGRQLASIKYGNTTWTHEHNVDGLRTYRSNGTTTYTYVYNGSSLSQMTVNGNTLYFVNDTVTYNGVTYYYVKNLQGDIVAILDASGNAVVEYTYNAWGVLLSTTGSMASTLGLHNPLRYRGYVYDPETALYYLQSRYYDPDVGRFINADAFASTGQGILGNNMFAYCLNNPVMYVDPTGMIPKFLSEYLEEFTQWVTTPLGPLRYVFELNRRGELYEYWVDINNKVRRSRHHSDHGNSKKHPTVPHDHNWHDDDNGNNTQDHESLPPDPNFQAPSSNDSGTASKIVAGAVGSVAIGYVLYTGVKWLIAGLTASVTGGGSLILAGATP